MFFYSPMEAYVIYPIFSLNFVINNVIFYLLFAALLTILLGKGISKGSIISNNWGILSESLFRSILLKIENVAGPKMSIYLPLFYSIFNLVLFSNLLGLVPYSTTPTVELVITLSIAFTLLMGLLLLGFLTHKLYLLGIFIPGGTPLGLVPLLVLLEIIAYIFRTISLGLRLAINLITGHLLLKVSIGFVWLGYIKGTSFFILAIPLILLTVFLSLEILIAYLQAYILVFITIITLKDVSMN
jgi:F-type H+-transporting ATPase subunit a